MANGLFVTGTDTGVGKTRFCTLLLKALRSAGVDAVGMKPFCCGEREDAELLHAAAECAVPLSLINPVWLRVPASPYTASLVENRALDVDTAKGAFEQMAQAHEFVVVEGAGGWRVPLTQQLCLSDFALSTNLPVLVLVANRLGAINHTQLTVDSIRAKGGVCAGIVLNESTPESCDAASLTNRGVLEQLLTVPVLGEVAWGATDLDSSIIRALQKHGFIP
ncbi:MAG: dethiobiotin synthase [Verrucomicrobia bacterium]|nr:dethiobiotin synthase [Verrucomicrobiota bacterium]